MIDWWSWWITTAVALPVAALALVAAVVVKRREARAALGIVAVVAVGLGVASPFVMGEEEEGASAMVGERLTANEFARRADANCRTLSENPASNIGQPVPTQPFARKLDAFLPAFWKGIQAQGRLRPPAEEQATATRWMNAMTAVGHDFEAMRAAARSSDSETFQAAGQRLSADVGESLGLSKQLGQTYCFQR